MNGEGKSFRMIVRAERRRGEAAVADLVGQAFGRANEARLVERLRADGDAVVSLVAVAQGEIVGHVMLSGMSAPFRALGLAPVAVALRHQRRSVGQALIEATSRRAAEQGWEAVFVVGDPGYYARFGFRADLARGFSSPYADPYLMVLPLSASLPASGGKVGYAPAFGDLE